MCKDCGFYLFGMCFNPHRDISGCPPHMEEKFKQLKQ